MKKIVVWFSAVLLVLSLAACGNSTESAENNDTETTNSQPATDGSGSSGQEENVSVNDDSEKEQALHRILSLGTMGKHPWYISHPTYRRKG